MKRRSIKTLSAILLSAGLILAVPALAQMPAAQEQNGVHFVTGGVGLDEANAFKAARGEYNLHLTVTTRDGSFLADMPVKILNSRNQAVLDTATDGPYLFAKLPAGRYQVVGGGEGDKVQKRAVQVGSRGVGNVHFVF